MRLSLPSLALRSLLAFVIALVLPVSLVAQSQPPISHRSSKSPAAARLDSFPLFLPPVPYYGVSFYARSIAIADVNGDGKPDLIDAATPCFYPGLCGGNGHVDVFLGNGDGTFQTPATFASGGFGGTSIATADLKHDGTIDVVTTSECDSSPNCSEGVVGVLLGNGDGTFQPAVAYSSGGQYPSAVAIADVNGDGKLDLVVINNTGGANGDGIVAVLLGNGDGTFQSPVTYPADGNQSNSLVVADLNHDGKLDIAVANSCTSGGCDTPITSAITVLLGNGDGTFQPPVTYNPGGLYSHSLAAADLNGDGNPDLVVAEGCGSVAPYGCATTEGAVGVLLGNGDGTFRPATIYDSGGADADSVVILDVFANGPLDLAVSNLCRPSGCSQGGGSVGVLLGNGDGTFQPAAIFPSSGDNEEAAYTIAAADLNADGRTDLAIADDVSLNVLMNDTGPHSSTTTNLVPSANPAMPKTQITFTATVVSPSGKSPTGSILFTDVVNGKTTTFTATLASSHAVYSALYKVAGSHTVTAVYSGDADNLASSATLTELIAALPTASKTSLTTSASPSFVGQPVTFTATVTWLDGFVPDGETVSFYDGSTPLGTGATSGGVATLTTSSLAAKSHTLKASYPGDSSFKPSFATTNQVIAKYATSTALTSSMNPSQFKQPVTFTATVTPTGPFSPTGSVVFKDGTATLGMSVLSGGVATLIKSNLAVGSHSITATYRGDADSATSTSAVLTQQVN